MLGVTWRDFAIVNPARAARPAASASDVFAWTILTLCVCARILIDLTRALPAVGRKPTTKRLASGPICTECVRTGFHSGTAADASMCARPKPKVSDPVKASTWNSLPIPDIETLQNGYGAGSPQNCPVDSAPAG